MSKATRYTGAIGLTMVTGHFAYETFRLLDTSPTTWTPRLLDISPTGQFAYETVRLLDTSPTTWTFRLHDISPPIKLLDRRNFRFINGGDITD